MKIIEQKIKESELEIGYKCDICHKEIIYKFDFLPQKSTVTYSTPGGGHGECSVGSHRIDICSMECLLTALERVSFSADIHLSTDFIKEIQETLKEIKKR